jgi:hypothetical protein
MQVFDTPISLAICIPEICTDFLIFLTSVFVSFACELISFFLKLIKSLFTAEEFSLAIPHFSALELLKKPPYTISILRLAQFIQCHFL